MRRPNRSDKEELGNVETKGEEMSKVRLANWRTRDGRKIKIADMSTSHIENTIALLRREGYISSYELDSMYGYAPQGEMAQYHYEQECESALSNTTQFLDAFEDELERRAALSQQKGCL